MPVKAPCATRVVTQEQETSMPRPHPRDRHPDLFAPESPPLPAAAAERRIELLALVSALLVEAVDRKSTRLISSHMSISYAVFCLKKRLPLRGRAVERAWCSDHQHRPSLTRQLRLLREPAVRARCRYLLTPSAHRAAHLPRRLDAS